jgi:hypothetical protein
VVLSRELTAPQTTLTAAEEAALLPGAPHYAFEVRVAQISAAFGPGAPRHEHIYL